MSQSLGSSVGVVINEITPGQASPSSKTFANISQSTFSSYGSLASNIKVTTDGSSNSGQQNNPQTNQEHQLIKSETTKDDVENHSRGMLVPLIAGAMAGAVAKTTIAPLDRTKINFQTNNQRYSNREALRFLAKCYKNDGFFSLWRGNSATMARIVPYAAVQFAAHEQWKKILKLDRKGDHPAYKRVLAGSLAGVTSQFLTYPLDLARARMAVTKRDTYSSLSQMFSIIVKKDGILTLYRGLTPTLLGVIPYAGTSFGIYETLKAHHKKRQLLKGKEEPVVPNTFERLTFGAVAGLVGQTSSYPLDIARRRMQTASLTGNSSAYKTIRGTLRKVYREEGIAHGLYKGVTMNWVKGPISVGISFAIFDHIKSWLEQKGI